METVICIVIATFVAVGMISNLIDSAVETVRKNTAQQFKDFTSDVDRMLETHQKVITDRLNGLVDIIYSLEPSHLDTSIDEDDTDAVKDVLLCDVAKWAVENQGITTSAVQRHFSVGYSRAGKIVDQLYGLGVCGPRSVTGVRAILITMAELDEMVKNGTFN